jgi:hypothetical protein
MNMPVRAKRGEGKLRILRRGHAAMSATARQPKPSQALSASAAARRRRHGGPAQDHALYNCECGMVFEAAVSTAVDCPHCGRMQAW